MLSVTQVRHDGFARMYLYRECDPDTRVVCAWCGTAGAKYRYSWHAEDNNRAPVFPGIRAYCGVNCWEAYTS